MILTNFTSIIYKYLLFCFLLYSFRADAQFHRWTLNVEKGYDLHLDVDSNNSIYASSFFEDSLRIGSKIINSTNSETNIAVCKFNQQGKCIWVRTISKIDNRGSLNCFGLRVINNREFIIWGEFSNRVLRFNQNDSLISSDTSVNFATGFIAKYDSSGRCIAYSKVFEGKNISGKIKGYSIGHLDELNGEAIVSFISGGDSFNIFSRLSKIKISPPNKNSTSILIKYSSQFDSIKWFNIIDVGNKGTLEIQKIRVCQGNLYFAGNYSGAISIGKYVFKPVHVRPWTKSIFGIIDKNGNIQRVEQINKDTNQGDFIYDISPFDSNRIFLVGAVSDSINYDGRWYSSLGKKNTSPANRLYPFFACVNFNKAYWFRFPYFKQGNSPGGSFLNGRCKHDFSKSFYATFEQFGYPIILGGLTDSVPAHTGFVKFDSLGNALWIRRIENYSVVYDFATDRNSQVVYSGLYTDSINLNPFKLKTKAKPYGGFITQTYNYQIIRGNVSSGPYCAGDTIRVPYTKIGVFNPGNYFVAELSDEYGNFNGRERELGRIKDTGNAFIKGVLPMFQMASSGLYRIRIRSTSPIVQSIFKIDSLRLLIYSRDKANPGPTETLCSGDSLQLQTFGGTRWQWSPAYNMDNPKARRPRVWPLKDTVYQIIISDSSGCGQADTALKQVYVRLPLKSISAFKDSLTCQDSEVLIPVSFEGGDSNYLYSWYYVTPSKWYYLKGGEKKLSDTLRFVVTEPKETLCIILGDGCSNWKDTTYITMGVKETFALNKTLRDTSLCYGAKLSLTNSKPTNQSGTISWQWTDISNSKLVSRSDTANFTAFRSHTLRIKANNGCYSDSFDIQIKVSPQLSANVLLNKTQLSDTTLCYGQELKLYTIGKGGKGSGYSFLWYLDKTLFSTADTIAIKTNAMFSNTSQGKTLKLRLSDQCSAPDSISRSISVIPSPKADFTSGLTCNLNPIQFNFTGTKAPIPLSTNFNWDFAGEVTSTLENPLQKISAGKRWITLKAIASNGCVSEISKDIDIKAQAKANFDAEDVCEDTVAEFVNKSLNTANSTNYLWYFGDGKTSDLENPKHQYNIAGVTKTFNVKFVANIPNGCSDSVMKAITINAIPKKGFKFTVDFQTVHFSALETTASQYQWTFGDGGTATVNKKDHSYTYSKFPSGKYKPCLQVTNLAGCTSDSCLDIQIWGDINSIQGSHFKLYPNPNSGSFNLEVSNPQATVEVFNSLGQRIYQSKISQSKTQLDLNLENGIYLVRVLNEGEIWNHKILVRE